MSENIFQTYNSSNACTYVCLLIVDYYLKSFICSLICYHECESKDVYFKSFKSYQIFGYDVLMKVFESIKVSNAFNIINDITLKINTAFQNVPISNCSILY